MYEPRSLGTTQLFTISFNTWYTASTTARLCGLNIPSASTAHSAKQSKVTPTHLWRPGSLQTQELKVFSFTLRWRSLLWLVVPASLHEVYQTAQLLVPLQFGDLLQWRAFPFWDPYAHKVCGRHTWKQRFGFVTKYKSNQLVILGLFLKLHIIDPTIRDWNSHSLSYGVFPVMMDHRNIP